MHPRTQLGWVHLSVADLGRSLAFYQGVLGLRVLRAVPGFAAVGAQQPDDRWLPILFLSHQPNARPKPRHCRGLYHFALRLPTRRVLAQAVVRLARSGWAIDGAADHWVSEAVYLSDPDGHGVELYADRPPERWPRRGDQILMATEPLDFDGLLAEARPDGDGAGGEGLQALPDGSIAPGTRLGHIHLHVSRLDRAERFYRDVLGLDLVLRYGASALFFSAGGYHHHVGANIWAGQDAPPPPPDAVQLLHFSFVVPSPRELELVADRLGKEGLALEPLERLGREVLESLRSAAAPTEGFALRDTDGQAMAVVASAGVSAGS